MIAAAWHFEHEKIGAISNINSVATLNFHDSHSKFRHAELVSATNSIPDTSRIGARWMLNQVQHEGSILSLKSLFHPFSPRKPGRSGPGGIGSFFIMVVVAIVLLSF